MSEIWRSSPWMTRAEAAKYAGVRKETIYSLCQTGALKSYLPLGASEDSQRRVVFKDDVDELIKDRVVRAPYAALVVAGAAPVLAELPEEACA